MKQARVGFSAAVDEQLMRAANLVVMQKLTVLLLDEIRILSDKHSGNVRRW